MAEAVVMPRAGQSVESCIITQWLKKVGDPVEKGEILFSYETDKAAFDEEAVISGVLLAILFEEGDEVPVLENVAVIGQKGDDISQFSSISADKSLSVEEKPSPAKEAKAIIPEVSSSVSAEKRIKISPRAKRMADSMQLNIKNIRGTGPMGRIIVSDIENSNAPTIHTNTTPPPVKRSTPKTTTPIHQGFYTDEKLSNIRKIIADNMMKSLQQSAQLTHHTSADARRILTLRKEIKNGNETRFPATTTLNDMVCYAIVRSLQTLPEINAHFLGDTIRRFNEVHMGIAVDTPRGLMVPSLRNAERYNLGGLGNALKDLANDCKSGTIDPDLLSSESASFTVSNLGVYGVEMFTPVINLPQCGIMGINTIIQRPADLGDGSIGFIPHIGLSLTYDHRALDGAPASQFLQEVKNQIENLNPEL